MPKCICTGRPVLWQVYTTEASDNCYGILCQARKFYQKKKELLIQSTNKCDKQIELDTSEKCYMYMCMFIVFSSFAIVGAFSNAVIILGIQLMLFEAVFYFTTCCHCTVNLLMYMKY